MSARILSMGPTTLRFARSADEIACRHFPTHLMYIGGSTLRFREAATRCQAIHARWVICNRYPVYQEIFEVGNWGKPGLPEPAANEFRPALVPSLFLLFTPSPTFILGESVMLSSDL